MKRVNRKSLNIITAPAVLAVSVADMKSYLRVDTSDDDDLIQAFIESATEYIKQYIRRSLITETLELTMDGFGTAEYDPLIKLGAGVHTGSYAYLTGYGNEFDLPFCPIQSITSIKTYDRDNTESTYSSANYELDETGGRVYLNEGYTWPSNLRAREAVKVRYVSGYGDAGSDIPAPITQAIKLYVGKMYDCREACEMPDMCKSLLAAYKLYDDMGY